MIEGYANAGPLCGRRGGDVSVPRTTDPYQNDGMSIRRQFPDHVHSSKLENRPALTRQTMPRA